MGGDWSVAAIVMVLTMEGYQVSGAVSSKAKRTWTGKPLAVLLADPQFRGIILHQPKNRHFTCLRPEEVDGKRHLFFVDSQSSGPIRISIRLAERRCLAAAYAWEPYIVMGKEMDFVAPPPDLQKITPSSKRVKTRPSEDFMKIWNAHSAQKRNWIAVLLQTKYQYKPLFFCGYLHDPTNTNRTKTDNLPRTPGQHYSTMVSTVAPKTAPTYIEKRA